MFDWLPFALGAAILIWGVFSFGFAASGGKQSGLHEVAPHVEPEATAESIQRRRLRRFEVYQWLNYALGIIVGLATIALILGAIFV